MKKYITVDFYKVITEATPPMPFADLLSIVAKLPDDETRNRTINRCPVRLAQVIPWEDCLVGEMVRLRVTEPAIKGSTKGKLARISMQSDEFLSGLTAFLFHPRSQLLCLERNRSGVGAGTFSTYFSSAGNLDGTLELRVVIDPKILQRMNTMKEYKALEVRIATFEDLAAIKKDVPSVAGGVAMAKFFDAPFIDFKLSMGHNKGGLTMHVKEAVRDLLKKRSEDPEEVTKIRVIGRDAEGDDTEPLDLIAHRVKHEDSIELSHDPAQSFDGRSKVLMRAWKEKRGLIKALAESVL